MTAVTAYRSVAIVTPVLDDWESLSQLIDDLERLRGFGGLNFLYVAADDGSREPYSPERHGLPNDVELHVVELKANQGHQRAIALGLAYVERALDVDAVVVMDSDGEDRPADVIRLVESGAANPGTIVCAKRAKRSESALFRLFYAIYKTIFWALTGRSISFGNFSLIPGERLTNVLYSQGIWNNIAATLLRCRVPLLFLPTIRGRRYAGRSRMNFVGLVVHGISVISVFSDVVIARIVIMLTGLLGILGVGILVTLGIKLEGGTFIPGYATNVILFLTNMVITSLFIGFAVVIMLLNTRTQASSLPAGLFDSLVKRITRFGRHIPGDRFLEAAE